MPVNEKPKPKPVSWFVPVVVEVQACDMIEAEEKTRDEFKNPGALALFGTPFTKGENYIAWKKN